MAIKTLLTKEMIDQYTAAGYWGCMTLGDWLDQHAAYSPDRIAVIDPRHRDTYGELKKITDRVALKLLEIGLRPGDRLGIQTPNWAEYFYVRLACAKIGVIVATYIFNVREHEIELMLNEIGAKAFAFCTDFNNFDYIEMADNLKVRVPSLEHFICIGERTGNGMLNLNDIINDEIEKRYEPGYILQFHPSANDLDVLMNTSGSTAKPKIVLRTPNIFLSLGQHIVRRTHMVPEDVVLTVAPVNQGTGYSVAMVACLIAGCTNVMLERFYAEEALRLIQDEKVTMAVGVPAHMMKMLNCPTFNDYDLSTLKIFYHAGAPLPPDAAAEFADRFGCRLVEAYGALDGGTPTHTVLEDPPEKTYPTVGKACAGMIMRIVDDRNVDVPAGQEGEIIYKGPNCAVGLWENPEHDYDAGGWFHSGDLGIVDEEGYLRIVGRKKEIIIRGGQNISPKEIENSLISHPAVKEIAVVKMPDAVFGEKACAFVVPRDGKEVSVKILADYLIEQNFAKYKLPERVEVVTDLPLLPNGKVNKKSLEATIIQKLKDEGTIK